MDGWMMVNYAIGFEQGKWNAGHKLHCVHRHGDATEVSLS